MGKSQAQTPSKNQVLEIRNTRSKSGHRYKMLSLIKSKWVAIFFSSLSIFTWGGRRWHRFVIWTIPGAAARRSQVQDPAWASEQVPGPSGQLTDILPQNAKEKRKHGGKVLEYNSLVVVKPYAQSLPEIDHSFYNLFVKHKDQLYDKAEGLSRD